MRKNSVLSFPDVWEGVLVFYVCLYIFVPRNSIDCIFKYICFRENKEGEDHHSLSA